MPEGLVSAESISSYKQIASHPVSKRSQFTTTTSGPLPSLPSLFPQGLHSASVPGILCLDVSEDTSRALTGGADKNAVVFEKDSEQVVATLRGHTKKVTVVVYHNKEVQVHCCSGPRSTLSLLSCRRWPLQPLLMPL